MRRMLIAAAVALLGFAGYALADGTIVRWNAIVGTYGHEQDSPDMTVAGIVPYPNWAVWIQDGSVTLDTVTGRVAIDISHASIMGYTATTPVGGRMGGAGYPRKAFFVCDATPSSGDIVPTEVLYLDDTASLKYRGAVVLPDSCRQRPNQITFLFGFGNVNGMKYFAVGAAQVLLNSDSDHD